MRIHKLSNFTYSFLILNKEEQGEKTKFYIQSSNLNTNKVTQHTINEQRVWNSDKQITLNAFFILGKNDLIRR